MRKSKIEFDQKFGRFPCSGSFSKTLLKYHIYYFFLLDDGKSPLSSFSSCLIPTVDRDRWSRVPPITRARDESSSKSTTHHYQGQRAA